MSPVVSLALGVLGVAMILAARQIGRDAERIRPIDGMTTWGSRAIGGALILGAIALLIGAP